MSQSGDGVALVMSLGGLSFHQNTIKVMQVNTCLYLSKGFAEYVLVLDLQELFIPKGLNWNFQDLLSSIKPSIDHITRSQYQSQDELINNRIEDISMKDKEITGHGWATDHAHPYCYITVIGEALLHPSIDVSNGQR